MEIAPWWELEDDFSEASRLRESTQQSIEKGLKALYPNLKLQLWKSGLRQNRLAQMLNLDETILSKIVNGYREPTAELKQRIASVLQCDVAWLFETAGPAPDPQTSKSDRPKSEVQHG